MKNRKATPTAFNFSDSATLKGKQSQSYSFFRPLSLTSLHIPFLFEDAPIELTQNRAVGAIHELPLRE
ncbi:MAG: hypothetical protein HWQ41_10370 [Nostoc sp. NOS(2021)]|uniref:hypothetical protein n=1 Tax=Nostoc sp. NOS(2021) TaxID=2815407 RepID=UPI0025FC97BC|nr:hypothetical protein [Nostoc sp. NOS(2021)]MBN3895649.1 hypothetical protein [Nostoc sp. NOS(2021)]